MKTHTRTLVATIVLLGGTAVGNAAHYRITIPPDDRGIAIVDATFVPQDGLLYMFPGADHLPERWSTFVKSMLSDTASARSA